MRVLETASYREVDNSDIHIAEYMTVLPSKEVLEQKLHLAVERAKERFLLKKIVGCVNYINLHILVY